MEDFGRPRIKIDWERVGEMVKVGSPATEIANILGIGARTLYQRCEEDNGIKWTYFAQNHKAKGDNQLREAQFKNALEGNTTMQVWLGKQRLDQRDKPKEDVDTAMKVASAINKFVEMVDGEEKEEEETDEL